MFWLVRVFDRGWSNSMRGICWGGTAVSEVLTKGAHKMRLKRRLLTRRAHEWYPDEATTATAVLPLAQVCAVCAVAPLRKSSTPTQTSSRARATFIPVPSRDPFPFSSIATQVEASCMHIDFQSDCQDPPSAAERGQPNLSSGSPHSASSLSPRIADTRNASGEGGRALPLLLPYPLRCCLRFLQRLTVEEYPLKQEGEAWPY